MVNKSVFSIAPSAVNTTLPTSAAERRCLLSINICCTRGTEQQTCSTPLLLSINGTGRRTDAQLFHRPCSADYAGNVSKGRGQSVFRLFSRTEPPKFEAPYSRNIFCRLAQRQCGLAKQWKMTEKGCARANGHGSTVVSKITKLVNPALHIREIAQGDLGASRVIAKRTQTDRLNCRNIASC